jgi:4-hydroxy-tetrahydrodipicolinate reductase
MLNIGIAGAHGRMGSLLMQAVREHELTNLVAVSSRDNELEEVRTHLQREGLVNVSLVVGAHELVQKSDVIIDFTAPEYSLMIAEECAKQSKIHICGTTGFEAHQLELMQQYARKTRIVKSANFSIGVNLLAMLTKKTAEILGDDYDIEIVEMHHPHKKDAPSGTALALGEAAADGRKVALSNVAEHGRHGLVGERKKGNIGFHALRGGDVIGDHNVIFAGNGERIELTHKSSSRRIYADGAIRAALWVRDKPNGLYSMQDVLA